MSDAADRAPATDGPVAARGGDSGAGSEPDGTDDGGVRRDRSSASPGDRGDGTASSGTATASVDRSPARTSARLAVGLAAVAALWLPTAGGRALGILGTALVAVGALRGRRRRVTAGAVVLVAGVAAAGLAGAPTLALVGATLCSLLAWDAGRYGITVGEQLGREASTTRLELAHVAATAAVGTAAALLGSASYLVVGTTTDGVAVVLLLVGVALVLSALR
ncbi:hypothetical protein I7X12_07620 [Halosimplex litoreum]|uniref:Uncharacterized protein n=1 Tax=Halosimplex litoreum TaxID=1198301 RepID=A0A7T3KX05_9EURY|nr:hypothetical protein [Halosimplex litoreum]QPV64470.1 hypothetical protein I7X12_07620 [Halosimplex litoreum]